MRVYGTPAIRNVAFVGHGAAGKTTLVNSIVGFNPPRRGKVVFKGDDITQK